MRNSILYIAILFLFSCAAQEEPEASLAVEAYLYVGKPIDHVKLSLIKTLNTGTSQEPVSDAAVYIIWNGKYYQLGENPSTPGTFLSDNPILSVIEGDTYQLYIHYHNQDYTAQTIVPKLPALLQASKDTLLINNSLDKIDISWQNPDSTWYLGVIEPSIPITTDFPFNNFFSLPTNASSISITPDDAHELGSQKFVLYGITDDYEKLYRISSSSIGASNVGNISNGFGIFAAFSSDTLSIVVSDK